MWDRKILKKKGMAAFKANYWKCVVVGILLILFTVGASASTGGTASRGMDGGGGSSSVSVLTNGTDAAFVIRDGATGEVQAAAPVDEVLRVLQDPEFQLLIRAVLARIGALLFTVWLICTCLRLLVFNPIEIGCRGFFTRNTEAPAGLDEVKTGFQSYGRNVAAMFLRDLFLDLWTLLFLVPGLIKNYSYRMVPYILADDPTIGVLDAITLSRKMMDGHKWNTFVLDLSFLGWDLLSVLTLGLLGVFYVNPYQFSTGAELYQALKDR